MSSTHLLSVSCHDLVSIENTEELETMWTAFNKCKNYIENGQRLENMSWRLWQYQRQPTNKIDNNTIKRFITSVLLSPAAVHDAHSHEVVRERCHDDEANKEESSCSSSIVVIDNKQQQETCSKHVVIIEEDEEEEDEDDDDDDYYPSEDDLYDDEDYEEQEKEQVNDISYHFVKTQPRPTTPRRSLLSDLLGRVSSPPSLLSNSTSSFTSTNTIEDQQQSQQQQQQQQQQQETFHKTNLTLSILQKDSQQNEIRWRESFHGW
ncbi:uncharacterized protein B0P05DRAFT_584478 [Gilbertella persicaria]|uniref:uncharacterized protein n=1 Tax=Gilbertella persicaria TaxID=101096 RepID=UPI00221E5B60|nr:uncharacterized protein B0P05DRAFT_584478 [Gilbertella persicaria]KAI8090263.1 hypothetical protein B0P05DRAFT_584478 [Gilbertella persicaria]